MPKTRPPYPPQLRARLIELARTGRTPEELGRQFEPSAQTIRNWLRQADRDDGRRTDGLTTEEREEVRRLRREVKALREEREILRNCRVRLGVPPAGPETPSAPMLGPARGQWPSAFW
jgi:transposase